MTSQWQRWRLKSPASWLFTQLFIRAHIKENIKAPRHWPLCGEFTGTGEFPAQRTSYAENVSIWWRHHEINASGPIYKYDIVSAIDISVLYDMIPCNISARYDISMMGYDARMVCYYTESIWYQDTIYQYYMMYQCDMINQYMTWHDSSMIWYSVSNLCNWYHDFSVFDPSVFWPFGVPVFGISALTRQCGRIEEIIAASDFEQQKEWDIVQEKFLLNGMFLLAFSA